MRERVLKFIVEEMVVLRMYGVILQATDAVGILVYLRAEWDNEAAGNIAARLN